MSHFVVLVAGNNVEEDLAPYDENLDTPRYVEYTKEQAIAKSREDIKRYEQGIYAEFLKDPKAYKESYFRRPEHITYLEEEFPKKLQWADEEHFEDFVKWYDDVDDEGNIYSTRNPNSKWDYWRVGGRWTGFLPLLPGRVGHSEPLTWEWTEFPNEEYPPPDREVTADIARKGDIDFEQFRSPYALVINGEWIGKGEMGWWGVTSGDEEQAKWDARVLELVQELDEDTRLTAVDCLI